MAKRKLSSAEWWEIGFKALVNLSHGLAKAWSGDDSPKRRTAKATKPKPKSGSARKRGPAKWWKVLGVSAGASQAEIRAAYRGKMMQTHPDRVAHLSRALQKAAERETKRLNEAYEQASKR